MVQGFSPGVQNTSAKMADNPTIPTPGTLRMPADLNRCNSTPAVNGNRKRGKPPKTLLVEYPAESEPYVHAVPTSQKAEIAHNARSAPFLKRGTNAP